MTRSMEFVKDIILYFGAIVKWKFETVLAHRILQRLANV